MLGGGGVDGAIHRVAGPELLQACLQVMPEQGVRCPPGQARITIAGRLASKYVIHTVGPVYTTDQNPKATLKSCYVNALDLALARGCHSIAFPAISCGVYGYPPAEAAGLAIEVCCREAYRSLDIRFYLLGASMLKVWRAECQRWQ